MPGSLTSYLKGEGRCSVYGPPRRPQAQTPCAPPRTLLTDLPRSAGPGRVPRPVRPAIAVAHRRGSPRAAREFERVNTSQPDLGSSPPRRVGPRKGVAGRPCVYTSGAGRGSTRPLRTEGRKYVTHGSCPVMGVTQS